MPRRITEGFALVLAWRPVLDLSVGGTAYVELSVFASEEVEE